MGKLNTHAAITWTSGTGTERVLLLDVPLRELRAGFTQSAYTAESLDKTNITTITVGSGAHELVGSIRYEDDPQGLLDLLAAGATNTTLSYYPDVTDADVVYTVKLVAPRDVSALTADLDSQRAVFGEAMATVRFRKTDQTAFVEPYDGTNVLFLYRAGDTLARTTFTRADTARYASKGYGTDTSAASGAIRIHWMDVDGDGVREVPTLYLEGTSTNLLTSSSNLSVWTAVGTPVLTSGQADPAGGTLAYSSNDDDPAASEYTYLQPTYTGDTAKACSVFLQQGTSTTSTIRLQDVTGATTKLRFDITWTAGVPSVSVNTGTLIGVERFRGGWYRIKGRSVAVTAANTHRFELRPTALAVGNTGSTLFYGAQTEDGLNVTSYIPTSGGTDARTRDALTFPFAPKVQTATVYLRYIQQGTLPWSASANSFLACLGNTSTTATRISVENTLNANTLSMTIAGLASGTSGTVVCAATDGQVVECRGLITYTPSARTATVQLNVTIAGGAETAGTVSSAVQVSDNFAGVLLALNGLGGASTNDAFTLTTHALVIRGAVSLASCRVVAGV